MNLFEKFKEPINKEDLMPIIRLGFFMTIIGGLLIGALHLLIMQLFGVSLVWMMLFLFGFYFAKRMKTSIKKYHIWHSVIAVIVIFVTYYLLNVVYYFGFFFIVDALTVLPFASLFNPWTYFSFINIFSSDFSVTQNLLDIVFFLIVIFYTTRSIK